MFISMSTSQIFSYNGNKYLKQGKTIQTFSHITYRNQDYKDCFDSHHLFQSNQKVGDKQVNILKYLVYVCKTDRRYVTHWFLGPKHYCIWT